MTNTLFTFGKISDISILSILIHKGASGGGEGFKGGYFVFMPVFMSFVIS